MICLYPKCLRIIMLAHYSEWFILVVQTNLNKIIILQLLMFIMNILSNQIKILIDKITILQIKTKHLQGTALKNVKKELNALESTLNNLKLNIEPTLIQRLKKVNQDLWQIEDNIREQEHQKSFGETFIRLARSVYQQNDQRAAIKKVINTNYGSAFVEEKSYQQY